MILEYRLVSKMWEEFATSAADHHPALKISFNSQLQSMTKDGLKSLSQFLEVIENSRKFPVSSFSFEGIDLLDSDVETFFDLHGTKIRVLGLEFWDGNKGSNFTSNLLRNLLTTQAPNLQELDIWGVPSTWKGFQGELFSEGTKLPHLKSINLYKGEFAGCVPLEQIVLSTVHVRLGGSSSKSFCDVFIQKYPDSGRFSSSVCSSTGNNIFTFIRRQQRS